MRRLGLIQYATDKHGQKVKRGDRVAFYKPRWWGLFGSVRAEGTVSGVIEFYGIVNILEDGAKSWSLAWGRQGHEIERLGPPKMP
jgi:hypothetical protein